MNSATCKNSLQINAGNRPHRPLGETHAMAERPVWKAVEDASDSFTMQTFYFGGAYVATGVKAPRS